MAHVKKRGVIWEAGCHLERVLKIYIVCSTVVVTHAGNEPLSPMIF